MSVRSRAILKSFFETGDKPTQQQFADLIDSFIHQQDELTVDIIEGLQDILDLKVDIAQFNAFEQGQLVAYNADANYGIGAATLLEKIIPYYGIDGTMKLSIVGMGGEDISPAIDIKAGWNPPIEVNIVAENAMTLYVQGIPNGSKLLFIKRKLKLV